MYDRNNVSADNMGKELQQQKIIVENVIRMTFDNVYRYVVRSKNFVVVEAKKK